jgi:hypothetical protein
VVYSYLDDIAQVFPRKAAAMHTPTSEVIPVK